MSGTVVWLFGRGVSIGCGLNWDIPSEWDLLSREEKINRIKTDLSFAMKDQNIKTDTIHNFLKQLALHRQLDQRHLLATTNWDYLLQNEILTLRLRIKPQWLADSHVFHINGSIEDLADNKNRSKFIMPDDNATQRVQSVETESFFRKIIWAKIFVVVGMSFECTADKFLFQALQKVEDHLPVGDSHWIIVNPDPKILDQTDSLIRKHIPSSKVDCHALTLDQWRLSGMPSLY